MSYEFSWNLLESTFDKVGDVLGDTISDINFEQEVMDESITNTDCELPMENQINEHIMYADSDNNKENNHDDLQFKSLDPALSENMAKAAEEILPQGRSRSNSWPRRKFGPSLNLLDPSQQSTILKNNLPLVSEEGTLEEQDLVNPSLGAIILPKKNSRRNPWGNYSYSDIIVQAIATSPEQRLTLNQIYDWMISAITYFSDKQDNASSAGWKNSIRHNLSLHQKFLKIPNEDPGKSSWWTINPEAKQTNKPRRRATYGDSKSFQNKREKAKKKVDAIRSNGRLERASSINGLPPVSPPHISEPYRVRSNSSASSCDDISLSSFRSRSFSNSSTTSQTSPLHFPELTIPSFSHLLGNVNAETDLDDIRLDDLNLGSGPNIADPAEIIREYLHSTDKEISDDIFVSHNLTILEPRDNDTVGYSVIKFANSNSTFNSLDDPFFGSLTKQNINEHHDEERKMMIKNKLNSLIKKRLEITQNQSTISFDNKKNLESAFLMQIKMLQEEIEKLERQQPEFTNHPFFSDISYSMCEENSTFEDSMDTNNETMLNSPVIEY